MLGKYPTFTLTGAADVDPPAVVMLALGVEPVVVAEPPLPVVADVPPAVVLLEDEDDPHADATSPRQVTPTNAASRARLIPPGAPPACLRVLSVVRMMPLILTS
jgi:hypothetical protein